MGTDHPEGDDPSTPTDESRLRGAKLDGSEQKSAPDHSAYARTRNPDTELHLDGEEDTLYSDGLDIEPDEDDTLAGTRGTSSGIKP